MTESNLEQRVILAVGWLCKAERLAAPGAFPDADEMPAETTQSPHEYARAQSILARAAIERLARIITETRDQAVAQARMTHHKRNALAAEATAGEKAAKAINEKAHWLAAQAAAYRSEAAQCEGLLRVLRGQEDLPLPMLPLFRYAAALERLENASSKKSAPADYDVPLYLRTYRAFLKQTDRADRIAMTIALILCLTVIAAGLHYVFNQGRIELEITPLEKGRLRVICVNTTRNSILLNAPYDGGGLPREPVTHFGVLLELLDEKGQATRASLPAALWEYKDIPAHLYGPIVIGPMCAAVLLLDLTAHPQDTQTASLRLTLFRAPDKRYKTYIMRLPQDLMKSEAD